MVPESWSVNRLACELQMDRRALGKRLEGLKPVSETTIAGGKRVERLYRLVDVIQHLTNPDDEKLDLSNERAKLARLQQEKITLEIGELKAELVRIPAVAEHWRGMVSRARAKLLALPSRLAGAIAPPDRIASVQEAAQNLVYEALTELAGDGIPLATKAKVEMRASA